MSSGARDHDKGTAPQELQYKHFKPWMGQARYQQGGNKAKASESTVSIYGFFESLQ
jgi:hypothetical protein